MNLSLFCKTGCNLITEQGELGWVLRNEDFINFGQILLPDMNGAGSQVGLRVTHKGRVFAIVI